MPLLGWHRGRLNCARRSHHQPCPYKPGVCPCEPVQQWRRHCDGRCVWRHSAPKAEADAAPAPALPPMHSLVAPVFDWAEHETQAEAVMDDMNRHGPPTRLSWHNRAAAAREPRFVRIELDAATTQALARTTGGRLAQPLTARSAPHRCDSCCMKRPKRRINLGRARRRLAAAVPGAGPHPVCAR